jgi:hypothetical protein
MFQQARAATAPARAAVEQEGRLVTSAFTESKSNKEYSILSPGQLTADGCSGPDQLGPGCLNRLQRCTSRA